MADPNAGESKLHIDSDWKAAARAEKERLAAEQAAKEQQRAAEGGAAGLAGDTDASGRGLPPADFKTLVSTMVTQALFALGAIPDPMTGQRVAHLDLAAHHIDMLGVIEEKTRGNLNEEEKNLIEQAVRELRMHYLELGKQYAAHLAQQGAAGQGGVAGGAAKGPGGLISP